MSTQEVHIPTKPHTNQLKVEILMGCIMKSTWYGIEAEGGERAAVD